VLGAINALKKRRKKRVVKHLETFRPIKLTKSVAIIEFLIQNLVLMFSLHHSPNAPPGLIASTSSSMKN
jgi:hypothetical protein